MRHKPHRNDEEIEGGASKENCAKTKALAKHQQNAKPHDGERNIFFPQHRNGDPHNGDDIVASDVFAYSLWPRRCIVVAHEKEGKCHCLGVEGFPCQVRSGGQQEPRNTKCQCRKFAFQTMASNEENWVCRTCQCDDLKHVPEVWPATQPHKWHKEVVHEHRMMTKDGKTTDGVKPFAMR